MDADYSDEYSYSERDDDDALSAELARIKKRKNENRLCKERLEQEEGRKVMEEILICGNPLVISNAASLTVKKKLG
ncbi:hypothetical protein MKX01_013952 [Papaver californicum]|nr:hypothetical protein MKX01_013952 [Papaver californicum]